MGRTEKLSAEGIVFPNGRITTSKKAAALRSKLVAREITLEVYNLGLQALQDLEYPPEPVSAAASSSSEQESTAASSSSSSSSPSSSSSSAASSSSPDPAHIERSEYTDTGPGYSVLARSGLHVDPDNTSSSSSSSSDRAPAVAASSSGASSSSSAQQYPRDEDDSSDDDNDDDSSDDDFEQAAPDVASALDLIQELLNSLPNEDADVSESEAKTSGSVAELGVETCLICWEDVRADLFFTLTCGHGYCRACLMNLVRTALRLGEVSKLACPDCREPIDRNLVPRMVPRPFAKQYALFLMKDLERKVTEGTQKCRNCEDGVLLPSDVDQETGLVVCRVCEGRSCFGCGFQEHEGRTCKDVVDAWKREQPSYLKKQARAKKIRVGMKAIVPTIITGVKLALHPNFRRCPGCGEYIEKRGGCHHMYCSRCSARFCWHCRGDYYGMHCVFNKLVFPVALPLSVALCAAYSAVALPACGLIAAGSYAKNRIMPDPDGYGWKAPDAAIDPLYGIYYIGEFVSPWPYFLD